MQKYIGTVQKRIGLLISVLGLLVVITNIINRTNRVDFAYAIKSLTVYVLLPSLIPFVISIFVESIFLKIMQIIVFLGIGTSNIIQVAEHFYGPSLFLVAWLVMRHYGFLDKYKKTKNGLMLIYIVLLSQFSSYIHSGEHIYKGFATLFFTLFLISILLIIWRDMISQQNELKKENYSLKTNYNNLASQLEEIEDGKKPYDLKASNISPAETRVIKTLTIYKASNREIAERLDLAESTVKLHLYNICNKIGVDNRFAIIDLCKYNF
ncbi:MAG: helix-turn-helix transcriptional regulator [Spirochaetales bacterium]|nr:helix-turn-helix transcriptional regulator [Spirochaetales bacterium]